MGRNFNAALATTLAIAIPGGATAAHAETAPAPVSPDAFERCADLATSDGPDQVTGANVSMIKARPGRDRLSFRMESEGRNPVVTEDGTYCEGLFGFRTALELRVAGFEQRVNGGSFTSGFAGESPYAEQHIGVPKLRVSGQVSYGRICAIARELQGAEAPHVRLVREEERTYTELGHMTVEASDTDPLTTLPCDPPAVQPPLHYLEGR